MVSLDIALKTELFSRAHQPYCCQCSCTTLISSGILLVIASVVCADILMQLLKETRQLLCTNAVEPLVSRVDSVKQYSVDKVGIPVIVFWFMM